MIEALNNYRIARKASENAAMELGRAFGEAFGHANPTVNPEPGPLEQLTANDQSIRRLRDGLGNKFGAAYAGFIKTSSNGYDVGFNLENPAFPHSEASQIPLEEGAFVRGFVEGFKESRR